MIRCWLYFSDNFRRKQENNSRKYKCLFFFKIFDITLFWLIFCYILPKIFRRYVVQTICVLFFFLSISVYRNHYKNIDEIRTQKQRVYSLKMPRWLYSTAALFSAVGWHLSRDTFRCLEIWLVACWWKYFILTKFQPYVLT